MKKQYQQPMTIAMMMEPRTVLCSSGYVDPDVDYGGSKSGFGGS